MKFDELKGRSLRRSAGWCAGLALLVMSGPAMATTLWDQDFTDDVDGWTGFPAGSTITHNAGGTATVLGGPFDCPGYVQSRGINPCYGGAFSQFGAYRSEWPGTWTAELDVYLDPNTTDLIDGRWGFDLIVAASRPDNTHLRDFVFHVGIVESVGLVVNGSNNADRYTNPFKLLNDNGGNYYVVGAAGWYTFQHVFYDNGGYLNVDLNLIKDGVVLWTATRVTTDVIGDGGDVGGNRYAWFSHVDSESGIEIDNHKLYLEPTTGPALSCVGFKPPADRDVQVNRPNRVVPLRMQLLDEYEAYVGYLESPPVLQAIYEGSSSDPGDLEDLNTAGRGDEGNTFSFDGTYWAFNLSTRGLAKGTYNLSAVSGDESEYVIDPTCEVKLVIK
jgi:hypothetical protein